jgi:hypothetical protein
MDAPLPLNVDHITNAAPPTIEALTNNVTPPPFTYTTLLHAYMDIYMVLLYMYLMMLLLHPPVWFSSSIWCSSFIW